MGAHLAPHSWEGQVCCLDRGIADRQCVCAVTYLSLQLTISGHDDALSMRGSKMLPKLYPYDSLHQVT